MGQVITITLTEILGIIDVLTTNQKVVSIIDTLALAETKEQTPLRETINQSDILNITQIVKPSGINRGIELNNNLHLTDKLIKVNDKHFKDKLIFTQLVFRIFQEIQNLSFTDNFIIDNGALTLDFLEFTETLIGNHLQDILLNDTLVFTDHGTAFKIPKNNRVYDQVYTSTLPITRKDHISFTYNNDTLILRNPSFGNSYKYNYNRQQLETRGKTLIISANSTYQYKRSVRNFSFTIEYLKQLDRIKLYNFFNNSIGQPVYMIDHENIAYSMLIITPELEFTQQDINNYSVNLDMEMLQYFGPVPSPIVDSHMEIINMVNIVNLTN